MTDQQRDELLAHMAVSLERLCASVGDRLELIESTLERLAPPPRTASRRDYAVLARLLPALAGHFGEAPFMAIDILTSPLADIVRPAIAEKQRPNQALGRFLKRCAGVRVRSHWLEFQGESRSTGLWTVRTLRLSLPIAAWEAA